MKAENKSEYYRNTLWVNEITQSRDSSNIERCNLAWVMPVRSEISDSRLIYSVSILIILKKGSGYKMKTSELYKREIGFIKNETMRKIVTDTLDAAPECIQIIPASSSGKYHPKADLGEGGLVRHTQAVVGFAKSMIDCDIFREQVFGFNLYPNEEVLNLYADVAYASLILHDCCKPDDTPKHSTKFDHPLLAANLFVSISKKCLEENAGNIDMQYIKTTIPMVKGCIASHMGQFNTAPYAKGVVLPKPSSQLEVFCHTCDYLASRKYIDFDFEKYGESIQ